MSPNAIPRSPDANQAQQNVAMLARYERDIDQFLASPVSRSEPMLMGSPAAPTVVTAYSQEIEQVYCDGVLAIMTIATSKLFRFCEPNPFTGVESYFRSRFSLSRAQVYRYLNCAAVILDLISAPPHMTSMLRPLPLRQRVAKAIKDLASSRAERQTLWAAVLAQQPPGLDITSTDVYRVAALLDQEKALASDAAPQPQISDYLPQPRSNTLPMPAVYPSPPSEAMHTMDDGDEQDGCMPMLVDPVATPFHNHAMSPFASMSGAAAGDSDPSLYYPSPEVGQGPRQLSLGGGQCAAAAPTAASEGDRNGLDRLAQVALDDASTYPSSGLPPVLSTSPSIWEDGTAVCQASSIPLLCQPIPSAAPPTRVSALTFSQSYRASQAALRGPAFGVMSRDLCPRTLRPESPALVLSAFSPSVEGPAAVEQWNCQLPPVKHLIALIDQTDDS